MRALREDQRMRFAPAGEKLGQQVQCILVLVCAAGNPGAQTSRQRAHMQTRAPSHGDSQRSNDCAARRCLSKDSGASLSVERRARQSQQTPGTAHALKTRRPRRLADKLCLLRGASREKDRRSMKRRNVHGGKSPATQPRAGPGRVLVRVATSQQQQQYFAERFHRAHCFRSHPAWWPCRSASGGGAPPHRVSGWKQPPPPQQHGTAAPARTAGASPRAQTAAGQVHARPGRRAGRPCARGMRARGSRAPRGFRSAVAPARERGALQRRGDAATRRRAPRAAHTYLVRVHQRQRPEQGRHGARERTSACLAHLHRVTPSWFVALLFLSGFVRNHSKSRHLHEEEP